MDPSGPVREAVGVIRDRRVLPFLVITLAAGAVLVATYRAPDWDYRCYVNAAVLIDQGKSPYSPELGTQYLYPPPMAHLFRALRAVLPDDQALFALYQGVQLVLLGAAFLLATTLARRLGLGDRRAPMLAAAVLIANFPLLYTLRHHNTNLALLDAALAAMLFPRAAVSGLVLAGATLLKLYPAFLLVPLWAFGYRRIAVWWGAGMLLPMLSSGVRADWPGFIELLPNMPKGEAVLDSSVTSLIERGARSMNLQLSKVAISAGAALAGLAALALIARRLFRARAAAGNSHAFFRSCAEWTAVVLLLSPIAWPEHFVLAVPLVLVLLAEQPRRLVVAAGIVLVLALPRTPHYPLSHHFLAGLVLLLSVAPRYPRGEQIAQR